MKLAELRDGWNGPQVEINYVVSLGESIGKLLSLENGKGIELVGSRVNYSYISIKRLYKYLREYNLGDEYDDTLRLFTSLDRLAHQYNLCSKDISELTDHLPSEFHGSQRERIVRSLERGIETDWDLVIPRLPQGFDRFQHDETTGAYIDIWPGGTVDRPRIVHHYPDY